MLCMALGYLFQEFSSLFHKNVWDLLTVATISFLPLDLQSWETPTDYAVTFIFFVLMYKQLWQKDAQNFDKKTGKIAFRL